MEVQLVTKNRVITGSDEFLLTEHSGVVADLPDELRSRIGGHEVDGGEWIALVDDEVHIMECPPDVTLSGSGAYNILNYGGDFDEELVVHTLPSGDHITIADGEVIEKGCFRPFLIVDEKHRA